MIETNFWFWAGFIGFVLTMLALDLGVFHRKAHEVRPKEAATWRKQLDEVKKKAR